MSLSNMYVYGQTYIGNRNVQQDRILMMEGRNGILLAVCDGMGGTDQGEIASSMAVEILHDDFQEAESIPSPQNFFFSEAHRINDLVTELRNDGGEPIDTGSTLVGAMIVGSEIHTVSVGDSRIYLYRDGNLAQLTRDHNYRLKLDLELFRGEIDEDYYRREEYRSEALISYLGSGEHIIVDASPEPITACKEDFLILSSDGLYKALSAMEISDIIEEYRNDPEELPNRLIERAIVRADGMLDNISVIVAKCVE